MSHARTIQLGVAFALCGCGSPAEPSRRPLPETAATSSSSPAPFGPPPAVAVAPPSASAASVAAPFASATSSTNAAPKTAPRGRAPFVIEREIATGRWPERVVVVGDAAWVAESGTRRVGRYPLDGQGAASHVSVGRLPVQLAMATTGKLYALAHTDKQIWEIDPEKQRVRIAATLSDCPQSMTLAGDSAWVLLWSKCSSADSAVTRVDLTTGKQSTSPQTGAKGWDIGHGGGRAWVARADSTLVSVDATRLGDMKMHGVANANGMARHVAPAGAVLFISDGSGVGRFDATTGLSTAQVDLGQLVVAIATDGDRVLVGDVEGTLYVLDARTLAVREELSSPRKGIVPQGLATWGERLVVTAHGPGEERGILLVVSPRGDASR